MNNIKEFLKTNILITDGSMGTYYKEISENPLEVCELANIYDKETIYKIHKNYISSGAMLIRTNTFGANTAVLGENKDLLKRVISEGFSIARQAAEDNVFVAASIGPIPDTRAEDEHLTEYYEIINTFIDSGADIFIFETFNTTDYIEHLSKYIKSKLPNAFILTEFALTSSGVTKKALSYKRILNTINKINSIDAVGFNCGIGPTHMLNIFKKIPYSEKILSALPNAGYPELINNRIEYSMQPQYFAEVVSNILSYGVKIVGGCCGTTPKHISLLNEVLSLKKITNKQTDFSSVQKLSAEKDKFSNFQHKLKNNEFVFAVELDPPFKTDISKLIDGARLLKENGIDIITIADSPMGKSRADSVIISTKIAREVGIETLPHICCRDRNSISMRSVLLGAYIEGVQNVLAVTGDPIPGDLKDITKSVFNLSSFTLIKMISEMNKDVFKEAPIKIGGAVNFNVKNPNTEFKRMEKKASLGAEFFLTQPIFTKETIDYIKGIKKERDYKILGGIMPLVSYTNALFINNELAGINIPEEYISRFNPNMSREEAEEVGIQIAVEVAEQIIPYVDGLYMIAPFNRCNMIAEIKKRIKK